MLPLVQFALQELFDRREVKGEETLLTFAAYSDIGGLDGAIDKRAEAAMAALGEAEQAACRGCCASSPCRRGRRAAARRSPSAPCRSPKPLPTRPRSVWHKRLSMPASCCRAAKKRRRSVRLAHERVLKSWKRAADIVRDNADFYRIRDDVEDQLDRWSAANKPDDLLIPPGLRAGRSAQTRRRLWRGARAGHARLYRPSLATDDKRVRARRLRHRLTAAAAALFAGLAVFASWQWQRPSSRRRSQVRELLRRQERHRWAERPDLQCGARPPERRRHACRRGEEYARRGQRDDRRAR